VKGEVGCLRPLRHFEGQQHTLNVYTGVGYNGFNCIECVTGGNVCIGGEPTKFAEHLSFQLSCLAAPMGEVWVNHEGLVHFGGIDAGYIEADFE
jgi:hypothetical protein